MYRYKKLFLLLAFIVLLLVIINNKSIISASSDPYYDLELAEIKTNPTKPVVNMACEIKIKVKFIGDSNLTNITGVNSYSYDFQNFELQEIILPNISISSPVKSGEYFYYTIKGQFNELGEATLFFRTDADNELYEQNMSNNDMRVKVNVVPADDLSVSSIEISPPIPAAGQNCKITIKVKNNGHRDLLTNIGIQSYSYSFESFSIEDKIIPAPVSYDNKFIIGDNLSFVFEGTFISTGNKSLEFNIDNDNRLKEEYENNNSLTKVIAIGSASNLDLAVGSIKFSKDERELLLNDNISITISIKNNSDFSLTSGDGLLERDYRYKTGGDIQLTFDSFEVNTISHDSYPDADNPLNPNEIFKYMYNGTIKQLGADFIYFNIDLRDKLPEINEDNNTLSLPVIVYSSQEEIDNFGVISNNYFLISSSSVMISWETDKKTDGSVWYKEKDFDAFDRFLLKIGLEDWPKSEEKIEHSIILKNLQPNTVYRYLIKAQKNNIEKETDLIEFTTPANDNLLIINEPTLEVDQVNKRATTTWETNLMSSSYVYYKKQDSDNYTKIGSDDITTRHEAYLDELEEVIYEFFVYSESEAKTTANSSVNTFTIAASEDEQDEVDDNEDEVVAENESVGEEVILVTNEDLYEALAGKIILKVESSGEAYYVNPGSKTAHYLGRPADAFQIMREQGVGITNNDLYKIPIGITDEDRVDNDNDGLADYLEETLGLEPDNPDTDGDGYLDGVELRSGYSPWGIGKQNINNEFAKTQAGKIFLQVEKNGEAWYVSPGDEKRYFLGRPADAFNVMRNLGLGISNSDFEAL